MIKTHSLNKYVDLTYNTLSILQGIRILKLINYPKQLLILGSQYSEDF